MSNLACLTKTNTLSKFHHSLLSSDLLAYVSPDQPFKTLIGTGCTRELGKRVGIRRLSRRD